MSLEIFIINIDPYNFIIHYSKLSLYLFQQVHDYFQNEFQDNSIPGYLKLGSSV